MVTMVTSYILIWFRNVLGFVGLPTCISFGQTTTPFEMSGDGILFILSKGYTQKKYYVLFGCFTNQCTFWAVKMQKSKPQIQIKQISWESEKLDEGGTEEKPGIFLRGLTWELTMSLLTSSFIHNINKIIRNDFAWTLWTRMLPKGDEMDPNINCWYSSTYRDRQQ
jgi:hypothetical protein